MGWIHCHKAETQFFVAVVLFIDDPLCHRGPIRSSKTFVTDDGRILRISVWIDIVPRILHRQKEHRSRIHVAINSLVFWFYVAYCIRK